MIEDVSFTVMCMHLQAFLVLHAFTLKGGFFSVPVAFMSVFAFS